VLAALYVRRVSGTWVLAALLAGIAVTVVFLVRPEWRPWPLRAGLFGLVHGLGFYSVLNALELGRSDVVTTLLSFNLGIEAGQIAIMFVLALPLIVLRERAWYRVGVRTASGVIACTGLWLVFERSGVLSL